MPVCVYIYNGFASRFRNAHPVHFMHRHFGAGTSVLHIGVRAGIGICMSASQVQESTCSCMLVQASAYPCRYLHVWCTCRHMLVLDELDMFSGNRQDLWKTVADDWRNNYSQNGATSST
jgi:hypothetical protein